jgi:hypothetical protein
MRHQGTYAMLIDYLMVGPDLYAVAAQASGDPLVVSTIVSNDISQLILLLITGIGIVLALAKLPIVAWLKT